MKKAFIVLLVVVGLLFTAGNAFGTEGNVSAKILGTPATLAQDVSVRLGFGAIIPDTTAGTAMSGTITLTPVDESGKVTVSTSGGLSTGVGVNGEAGAGYSTALNAGTFIPLLSAGKFAATGLSVDIATKYDIYLPSIVPLSDGAGHTIYASDFKAYTTELAVFEARTSFTTVQSGATSRDILIGATLTVPANATAGNYSGTYTIFLYADNL